MFIILGLIILVAAVVVGVAGVLTNHGSAHLLTHRFTVLGYHVNGSTGRLFLYGIVVGAVAVFGLSLLLSAARRTSRRGSVARQGLHQSRGETAAVTEDRDDLIDQRETARAQTASVVRNDPPAGSGDVDPDADRRSLLHPLGGHRAPAPQAATATPVATATPEDR
jgi:hypothetical protein